MHGAGAPLDGFARGAVPVGADATAVVVQWRSEGEGEGAWARRPLPEGRELRLFLRICGTARIFAFSMAVVQRGEEG